jgi:DNA replication and repair protein RecF
VDAKLLSRGLPRACRMAIDDKGRKLRLDGKNPRSLPDWFAHIKAVSFVPADLRMVDGPPDGRRDFLDRATFTLDPGYLGVVRTFRAALKNKNALLRDARRRGGRPDPDLLATWNDQLVAAGAAVVERRTDLLRDFAPVFRELHEGITGAAKGRAEFRYRGCVGAAAVEGGLAGIRAALAEKVAAASDGEVRAGFSSVGPHRDDWELHVGGEPLRSFGSQGQIRSAALALRVGQVVLARRRTGVCPLFLLDDVSSELDSRRNEHLMGLLAELETQVLITTTDRDNLRLDRGAYTSWRVVAGTVEED